MKEAQQARNNRAEIVRELSWGRVTRRDLIKMGLFTAAGCLAPIRGLSPFAPSVYGQVLTGMPPSPLFGCTPFSTPMPRFDVLPRQPVTVDALGNRVYQISPAPTAQANTTQQVVNKALGGGFGPIEGRPPGPIWAHQRFNQFPPKVTVSASQAQATTNTVYNPECGPDLNSGLTAGGSMPLKFHPGMPTQNANSVWTFNGTIPPKLVKGRYAEPILFRHTNRLPFDEKQNNGFGRHTISTHEHNGHHGAENDGFTGAFFFPGQFYDYHWPIVLAGHFNFNQTALDAKMARTPNDAGGTDPIPGDWRETMSTHWFHDHMFSFTSQNVYKGNAAMFNIYSGLDRGNEAITDGVNLKLPSGTANSWGNLDYDVNLMLSDKAFDANGQLFMDIFDFDGFIGDVMTVNLTYKPYFEVEARRYRFRILNASVSRFFKVALCDESGNAVPMAQIANDGNLLPLTVNLTALDEQGIAERYDVVIDFSKFAVGSKLFFVNCADHFDPETGGFNGRKPVNDVTLAQALAGTQDPCVGKFLQFVVVRKPANPDQSTDFSKPVQLIPNPDLTAIPVARERTFEFNRGASQPSSDPITSFIGPWGIRTDNGEFGTLAANFGRIDAAPRFGTREIWHLENGGGGWDHPIHIHFEEGQVLARNDDPSQVPAWEKGRKDVYRLRPGGTITITMQFRDWGGMFMEHCHNTVHEDNAMLVRWEIDDGGTPFLRPLPTPIPTPQGVTFENNPDVLPTAF